MADTRFLRCLARTLASDGVEGRPDEPRELLRHVLDDESLLAALFVRLSELPMVVWRIEGNTSGGGSGR